MTIESNHLPGFDDAKILVVDDNIANTALLNQVLTRASLGSVVTCNDSRELTKLLLDDRPDLILLDLHMPHVDGFELLEVISRHAAGEFLPVLVVTADTGREAIHRALQLGAHDFLTKPFDVTEVALRVRNLLRTRWNYLELRRERLRLQDHVRVLDVNTVAVEEPWDERRTRIEKVITLGGPRMVFQPLVDLRDGRTIGYEALARFDDQPSRGPSLWFAEADAVALGSELEIQAAQTALSHLPRMAPDQLLGINLSPATILTGLRAGLGADVPWERVVIELTEHVVIEDYRAIQQALETLRGLGAALSVDDTGAGFASLRHILDLAPDFVKLDISLCRGVDRDPARRALVSALVAFTREINCVIVAEGVEVPEERATLSELGVNYAQGYLLGRPAPLPTGQWPGQT
ncbi:MAG TPA: EAL domain-containing response regulator [Acidimicrobiales bacterium]|nr:EAL domain-containing response regulator [Acidimicrobiales bacterium]